MKKGDVVIFKGAPNEETKPFLKEFVEGKSYIIDRVSEDKEYKYLHFEGFPHGYGIDMFAPEVVYTEKFLFKIE